MSDLRVVDIVFATTSGVSSGTDTACKPIKTPTHLYQDLWVGRNRQELWEAVYRACRPQGHCFNPRPQFGQRYAFWNDNPADPSALIWDPDRRLATAIAISRLIHPTSIGFEYSARVILGPNGQIQKIIPGAISGLLAHAYIADLAARHWLTDDDAKAMRGLLASFYENSADLPPRIQRAFWNHEYAAGIEWIDVRWTVVATALESLVHTDRYCSTKQFVNGLTILADRIGVTFSREDAEQAYDRRSRLAHGGSLGSMDDATAALYCRMEGLLRASIRTAIQDEAFRNIFLSDDQIRKLRGSQ